MSRPVYDRNEIENYWSEYYNYEKLIKRYEKEISTAETDLITYYGSTLREIQTGKTNKKSDPVYRAYITRTEHIEHLLSMQKYYCDLKKWLDKAYTEMLKKEKQYIRLRYVEGKSLVETADHLDVKYSYLKYIRASIIEKTDRVFNS